MPFLINVGARSSKLSQLQAQEVLQEIQVFHPEIQFQTTFLKTHGDLDQKTSLRTLDKTDFFTREIDQLLLEGEVRIAIHSGKDLPEPLPKGLVCIAMTKGVDPSDALVVRDRKRVNKVATSSERREDMVRQLYPHATFVDIRGTIQERLAVMERGEVDGVVIAEAALIRLKLTHLDRLILPGETVPFQGRLAILAREEDHEMATLFSCINYQLKSVELSMS